MKTRRIEKRVNPSTSRQEIRVVITGPAGEAKSGWWWMDDGSAEQDAGKAYRELERCAARQKR